MRQPKTRTAAKPLAAGAAGLAVPAAANAAEAVSARSAGQDPPGAAPVWTLELAGATIPDGGANGSISGTKFIVETARIDPVGTAQVLGLRQGTAPAVDRELLIYLHLAAGEGLAGHTWRISQDMRGGVTPSLIKRWKSDPRYAAQQASFSGGYAMKLELGQAVEGVIPGKIFLALPDTQKSVVAGSFKATIGVPAVVAQQPAAPIATPAPVAPSRDAAMDKRYGIKR